MTIEFYVEIFNMITKKSWGQNILNIILAIHLTGEWCVYGVGSSPDYIEVQNQYYGPCFLVPVSTPDKLKLVLQNNGVTANTSIGDTPEKIVSNERINRLFRIIKRDYENYKLGFFEAYTTKNEFLGLGGFFCERGEKGIYPEICLYLLEGCQRRQLGTDIHAALIDYAFRIGNFYKVVADAYPNNPSTIIFQKMGYLRRTDKNPYPPDSKKHGQIRYELTRYDYALYLLSEMIKKERMNLLPRIFDLAKIDMERTRRLWYTYSRLGLPLCNGGVEKALLSLQDIIDRKNIWSFNVYRSDRTESVKLLPEEIKQFLLEESILNHDDYLNPDLQASFCLGGHEGFTRVARSIYNSTNNNGMFYPIGAYGFLACSAATMKPIGYQIRFVQTRDTSDQISLSHLRKLVIDHPKTKTLFLDAKTTAGAIYNTDEITEIVQFCKMHNIFLIMDLAHHNMEFGTDKFPNFISICKNNNFKDFTAIYTASKTYGCERGRVGFLVLHKQNKFRELSLKMERDLYRVLGSGNDLPFEIAYALIKKPLIERQRHLFSNNAKHHFNMNLMLAYIEGIHSQRIDPFFRAQIITEITQKYQSGIPGVSVPFVPEGGIQMIINTYGIKDLYLSNIQMFNAEIFSYALNKFAKVATIHSYQRLDPKGYSLRLSFSVKEHVHLGMQAIHDFMNLLKPVMTPNRFFPIPTTLDALLLEKKNRNEAAIKTSRTDAKKINILHVYKDNVRKKIQRYVTPTDLILTASIHNLARKIQKIWRKYLLQKIKPVGFTRISHL